MPPRPVGPGLLAGTLFTFPIPTPISAHPCRRSQRAPTESTRWLRPGSVLQIFGALEKLTDSDTAIWQSVVNCWLIHARFVRAPLRVVLETKGFLCCG